MKGLARLVAAIVLAVPYHCVTAQRQTGAPAGVQVPPVPVAPRSQSPVATPPPSAVFRVRVLDGRDGRAVRSAHVRLWYDEPAGPGYEFATDVQGYGNMPAPVGEPLRVLLTPLDYTDCRRPMRGDPPTGYNLASIAAAGVSAHNGCGPVAVHTAPGELVLYVRPARWYEGINRNVGN